MNSNEITYDTFLSDRVVQSVIKNINENEVEVKVKDILIFNYDTFDYIKVEVTPEQLEWYERKIALKFFNEFLC